jgi:hypothetical protein
LPVVVLQNWVASKNSIVSGSIPNSLPVERAASAVDPVLRELRERARAATRADTLDAAKALKRARLLRNGLSTEQAADIIYAIASSESVYLRLVEHRGWSEKAYARVIEQALAGALT